MKSIRQQLLQLNMSSKRSVALYHKFALAIGLSDSSLGVLYALLETQAPCSQYELCAQWSIPKQTVNTAVAALQKRGLVSLSPAPGARNKKNISLTDSGRAFARDTVGRLAEAEAKALKALTASERELYIGLNEKYNAVLAKELGSFSSGEED